MINTFIIAYNNKTDSTLTFKNEIPRNVTLTFVYPILLLNFYACCLQRARRNFHINSIEQLFLLTWLYFPHNLTGL